MLITKKDILRIADLAAIAVTDEEVERYVRDFSLVFTYMDMLSEVDTETVEETAQVTGSTTVVREDVSLVSPQEVRDAIVAAFPQKDSTTLLLPPLR